MITFEKTAVTIDIKDFDLGNRVTRLLALSADDDLKKDLSKAILNELFLNNAVDLDYEWIGHPPHVIYCHLTIPVFPKNDEKLSKTFNPEYEGPDTVMFHDVFEEYKESLGKG